MLKSKRRTGRLWRALASPVRRRMLDKLRDGPKTTTALARAYPKLSRFAVMQHLGVLSDAKLVLIRREGRFRYNHLNAVPLTQAYERWVSRYAAPMAHASIALKRYIEGGRMSQTTTKKPTKSPTEFRASRIELEVNIAAPPQRVWDALVNETTHWWRKDFYTKPSRGFHIEPRIGGRMYEDRGDGNGLIWANVVGVDAPESIQFVGHLTPQFGGPAHTIFQFTVKAAGAGSVVKISDTIFGNISESLGQTMQEGWKMLFEDALKKYVEKDQRAPSV
jgi:DNA-binding transcriptional ArsR family regulator/uncharacterized protein YndB with AHSA1/START domain